MRRVMLAAPWALLAYAAPMSEINASAGISECVQVAPENVAAGMSLQVANTCDFDVRCELVWRVRCEGDAPDAAARPRMSVAVALDQGARKTVLASGEVCGARIWEITDEQWECKEVR